MKTENPKYERNNSGKIESTTCTAPVKKYRAILLNTSMAMVLRQIYVQKASGSADVKVNSITIQPLEAPSPTPL